MNNISIVNCPNCNSVNPYFNTNCSVCNFFLRDKIPNINLGEIILSLIESPNKAFERIILSNNKNYVLLLLTFLSVRFFILSRFISIPFTNQNSDFELLTTYTYFFITTGLMIFIISHLINLFCRIIKVHSRFKDVFSVLVFSFFPSSIAIFLLYPIELTVYGKYLFSNNPYPFDIKENVFYVFIVFELFLIIWSFILQIKGLLALRLKFITSINISIFNYLLLTGYLFFSKKVFL